MITVSFFECHLNEAAGAFFGAQAATLAKIKIKSVSSGSGRFFNGIVRTVHKTVAAIKAKPAAETAPGLGDNLAAVKGRINFFKTLQTHTNRCCVFGKAF